MHVRCEDDFEFLEGVYKIIYKFRNDYEIFFLSKLQHRGH